MKKIISLSAIAVLILSMGLVAFADGSEEAPEWYSDMIEWRKERVQNATESGQITEDDARYWTEEIDRMEEYHDAYGYETGMMGRRGMRNNRRSRGNNFSRGFGLGQCHNW